MRGPRGPDRNARGGHSAPGRLARQWATRRRAPGEGIEHFEEWERRERAYWTKYAEVLAEKGGKPFDSALVQSRMKSFYQWTLEMEQVWVKKYGKKSQQM